MPDGSLLVVRMELRQVWRRWPDGRFACHADLTDHSAHLCNDIVVDAQGRVVWRGRSKGLDPTTGPEWEARLERLAAEAGPVVQAVHVLQGRDPDQLLALAAAVERGSEHPLAGAVLEEVARRGLPIPEATGFQAHPGRGAEAVVAGGVVLVGSAKLFAPLDDAATRLCVEAERAMNRALHGSCHVPVAAYASLEGDRLQLEGAVGSATDGTVVRAHGEGAAAVPSQLGTAVAQALLEQGARDLINAAV